MSEPRRRRVAVGPFGGRLSREVNDFTLDRMRWLMRMRWFAMLGVWVAVAFAAFGVFPGMAWPLTAGVAAVGTAYNFLLWRSHRAGAASSGPRAALLQALFDIVLLTAALWTAGGVECPFVSFYVFHVALIAILGGPSGTLIATAASFAGASLLALTAEVPALRIGRWQPIEPFDVLAEVFAFASLVSGAAYIVTHAVRELRDRERALAAARDRAALEYQILSNTLDELDAGLEVVDVDGTVLWRNKRAEELAPWCQVGAGWECPGERRPCERDVAGACPVAAARAQHEPGRCRFAVPEVHGEPQERVYEMLTFPIEGGDASESGGTRVMNLYVDRTSATLAERQLLLAERLASLGRVAQGVAHELNTPLATIRTLATDMARALDVLSASEAHTELATDLEESAELIRDETHRLGRITQALLAGGDLVRARIDGQVPLASVVERARAIVFAGVREGPEVTIDDSVSHLEVEADMDRLVQVLVNLLQNALDAIREHRRDTQSTERHTIVVRADREEDDEVAIRVLDDGPGLPPAMDGRLFEPFATTKPPGEGTGLGLYTSYMLVSAMGGQLQLRRRESGGTEGVIRLPAGRS